MKVLSTVGLMPFLLGLATAVSALSQEATDRCPATERPAHGADVEPGIGALPLAEVQDEAMLRTGPAIFCRGSYVIPAGGTVEVQRCRNDWCLVTYGNEVGYLPMGMLDRIPDRAPVLPD